MVNVLFDCKTLKVTGFDRAKFPFEQEILNVEVHDLKKQISFISDKKAIKTNDVNEKLYYYIHEVEVDDVTSHTQEVTEETDKPIMIQIEKQIPVLNANGDPVEYEVMEKVRVEGEYQTVGTGIFTKCYTTELVSVQKQNEENEPLFLKDVTSTKKRKKIVIDEITENDVNWPTIAKDGILIKEQLNPVMIDVIQKKNINFTENFSLFTYKEVILHKEKQMTKNTFFSKANLYETMDQELFSTNLSSFNADLGFDFISLPSNGEVRTIKLTLPETTKIVGIKLEGNIDGIEVKMGATTGDLQLVDKNNERYFDNSVSNIYVYFKNTSNKRIDINSFTLLV